MLQVARLKELQGRLKGMGIEQGDSAESAVAITPSAGFPRRVSSSNSQLSKALTKTMTTADYSLAFKFHLWHTPFSKWIWRLRCFKRPSICKSAVIIWGALQILKHHGNKMLLKAGFNFFLLTGLHKNWSGSAPPTQQLRHKGRLLERLLRSIGKNLSGMVKRGMSSAATFWNRSAPFLNPLVTLALSKWEVHCP